jgi:hypothetical protein
MREAAARRLFFVDIEGDAALAYPLKLPKLRSALKLGFSKGRVGSTGRNLMHRLLVLLSQKVAFWELGILDNCGRFVFRHEELRWITQ